MADSRDLNIKLKLDDQLSKGLMGVYTKLDKFEPQFKRMAAVGTAALTAIGYGAVKLSKVGAESASVALSFERMTQQAGIAGDTLVKELERLSVGTVSTTDLMLASNRAMALGVGKDMETMTTLMEIARLKGQNMGITTTQAFNDIVTGIGRGSPLILDNLGITIKQAAAQEQYAAKLGKTAEQLTDNEKKNAILNAVLESGRKELKATGDVALTASERMQQLSAQTENMKSALGEALLPVMEQVVAVLVPMAEKLRKFAEEHPEAIRNITLAAAAVAGLVATLGTLGLIIPKVVAGIALVKKIIFATNPALLALGVAVGVVSKRLFEFGSEVGGVGNAISLTLLNAKAVVLKAVYGMVEALGKFIDLIPGLKNPFTGALSSIRRSIVETEEQFNALAVEGFAKAAESSDNLGDRVYDMATSITDGMTEATESTDELDEGLKKIIDSAGEVRKEMQAMYQEIQDATTDYKKDLKGEEQSFNEDVVGIVAQAEEDIVKLKAEKKALNKKDDKEEIKDLENKIKEKQDIITTYEKSGLDFSAAITEKRKYLNMNELEQTISTHNRKLMLMQQEYLEGQVLRLQKLVELKAEHETILTYLTDEEKLTMEVELSKRKTFRDTLKQQSTDLASWMDNSINAYRDYVRQVQSMLSGVGGGSIEARATGGSVIAGQSYLVGERGAELFRPNTNGTIIPNNQLATTGGGITINITGNQLLSDDAGRIISEQIMSELRNNSKIGII